MSKAAGKRLEAVSLSMLSAVASILMRFSMRFKSFRTVVANFVCRSYPDLIFDDRFHPIFLQAIAQSAESSPDLIKDLLCDDKFCYAFLRAFSERWHDTIIPEEIIDLLHYATRASIGYGQEGEDLILLRLLDMSKPGFYVDIGAHHPIRFSNTYAFYRAGWSGLNVDATPGSMKIFQALRPRDTNVEVAVSDSTHPMLFHVFKEGALNTFDASLAAEYMRQGWDLLYTKEVTPRSLASVLDEYLPIGQSIELMSLDVEGGELSVLESNDWERFRPGIIVLEVLDTSLAHLDNAPAVQFLKRIGYVPVAKLLNSTIMRVES